MFIADIFPVYHFGVLPGIAFFSELVEISWNAYPSASPGSFALEGAPVPGYRLCLFMQSVTVPCFTSPDSYSNTECRHSSFAGTKGSMPLPRRLTWLIRSPGLKKNRYINLALAHDGLRIRFVFLAARSAGRIDVYFWYSSNRKATRSASFLKVRFPAVAI